MIVRMAAVHRVYSPVLSVPSVYKAHTDDTATAVLTYPVYDAEGEWVQPDGGDWGEYPLHPKVDWHHGTPVGRGEVTLKAITDAKGVSWVVPVGTTAFFKDAADLDGIDLRIPDPKTGQPTNKSYSPEQCLSRAAQARFLVTNDHATGVSVEFDPVERAVIGPSLLKAGRPAFRHTRWKGLGWAHTYGGDQINPGAQTVVKARPETLDLIRGGKLPDGTVLDAVIRKAFDPLLDSHRPAARVVSGFTAGGKKAMTDDLTAPPAEEPVAAAPESDTPDEAAIPTDIAQLLSDAADRLEEVAAKTLHKPSNKYLAKYAEEARALAEDLMAHADSIGDELASRGKDKDADDEPGEGEEDESELEKEAEEEEREEKSWPRVAVRPLKDSTTAGRLVCKAFNYVARLTMADLKPVAKADPEPPKPSPRRDRSHSLNRQASRLDRLLN